MTGKAKPEVWTRERCFITELVNDDAWPEVSLARCRVEPGVTTELHALAVLEFYVIERGSGLMHIDDDAPFAVEPGDTVTIPKRAAQSITNTGEDDLVFTCVCSPRFSQDCYTSLE
jgi:mannose-6-phosphate isomerase-like protein (cupin superfamily)